MEHEGDGANNCSLFTWNGPLKALKKDWRNLRLVEESKPVRPQNCQDHLEYSEKSWRPGETCCHHSYCIKRLPVNAGVKTPQKIQ